MNENQKNPAVTNQSITSRGQIIRLNAITTTVPTLPRTPVFSLNIAKTYSLCSTNNNPFQTNANFNATANPAETLYQSHSAPNIGPSASGHSSFSIPTVNPINPSPVFLQHYTVLFLARNKSVKTFDGFDHQYTPQEYLLQIDAHTIFTMGEQPLIPVAYNQWHKRMANIQSVCLYSSSWRPGINRFSEC